MEMGRVPPRRRLARALRRAGVLRLASPALALVTGARETGPLGGTEGPDLTRYLVVCSLLLLGIACLAWGFRRVVGRSITARAARRSLQVMDVLPVGGKQKLAVVRCYDRTFLLGMGEREVSLVAELDPVIEPAEEVQPAPADRAAFGALLERVRRGSAEMPAPRPAPRPAAARPVLGSPLGSEGVLG